MKINKSLGCYILWAYTRTHKHLLHRCVHVCVCVHACIDISVHTETIKTRLTGCIESIMSVCAIVGVVIFWDKILSFDDEQIP